MMNHWNRERKEETRTEITHVLTYPTKQVGEFHKVSLLPSLYMLIKHINAYISLCIYVYLNS